MVTILQQAVVGPSPTIPSRTTLCWLPSIVYSIFSSQSSSSWWPSPPPRKPLTCHVMC